MSPTGITRPFLPDFARWSGAITLFVASVRSKYALFCACVMIVAWSEFVFARTLVTKSDLWTVTVGLQSFVGEYLVDWPALMAAGVVSLAPMLVLFLLLEPFLVSGLTSGAVKQ